MDFSGLTVEEFVEALASGAPVPGGGGASALTAALGIALGGMVASLTLGKEKYAQVEDEMRLLSERAAALRKDLLGLIRRDAEAFEFLSRAYGLPRGSEEEKREREQVMEAALPAAAAPPLDIMEKCAEAVDLLGLFAEKGNRLLVSDAGTGAALCVAALRGARLNVLANTSLMKDRERAERLEQRAEALLADCLPEAERVYALALGDKLA
ncbi:MAG: cyclodeaminase/cyclohydrolase family protein [Clostridiales Family XIII bacterium]|jgi:formiminotetrahydrofolate cyclodeaminase|nr:cyclodeaminase/cyclohydrolase family protein [Clostridiales Family XIII bacterium]